MASSLAAAPSANPLLEKWTTLFGVPPFERIKPEHFTPALQEGLRLHQAEIAKIVANRKPATFENTIAAMERSGRTLDRAATILANLTGADTNDALDKIDLEISPLLTRHGNEILQNAALYKRVRAVYDQRDNLTPEQKRLVERIHIRFLRAGANLNAGQRKRLAAIDERRTTLATKFNQNLLADTKAFVLVLETAADMAGLPDFVRDMAQAEAKSRGMTKAGVITISRSSYEPFMKFSERRDLREKLFRAWTLRGDNGNEFDNKAIITETVALRAERAQLLGYASYAHFSLDDSMAKKPEAAMELMMRVWTPAREQALADRDKLQQMMSSEGAGQKIAPWDWGYYAEKVRQARFNLSETEIKPYFQLDKMIEAVFYTANRLYGLQFTPQPGIKGYHPDVRAWEVKDAQGKHIGVFLGDYFARPSKGGGAWMNSYRDQEKLIGDITPIIANHCNFNKPEAGQPALLSFDDVRTLFHEFGHALHGLLSNVTYPTLAGTAVPRDFVELPSQINEHWADTDDVLNKFARHYQTGQPMPAALLAKMRNAAKFDQGFATVEFVASALVDMEYHLLKAEDAKAIDPAAFEKQALAKMGMPEEITMRHRSPHFSHIFGGGYAAGYYSYLWAEVLDSDGFEAFRESGDVFNPELAQKFRENILSVGNSRDLMEAYRKFRGKDPAVEPLLRKRGLLAEPKR